MFVCRFLILVFLFVAQLNLSQAASQNGSICLLAQAVEEEVVLNDLVDRALEKGCTTVEIQPGEWQLLQPILLQVRKPFRIRSASSDERPILIHSAGPVFVIRDSTDVILEDLVIHGGMELERTERITIRGLRFEEVGIHLKGKKCSVPRECADFNKKLLIENSEFHNCTKGIYAERLESSILRENRFSGDGNERSCERNVGIELDGSSEEINRRVEFGHSKRNQILQNFFEHEFTTGIRVRWSFANSIRDNQFYRSFRALEFLEGALYNRITDNNIGHLSQLSPAASCQLPSAIYLGLGSAANYIANNFFESIFDPSFPDLFRNRIEILDESGRKNRVVPGFTTGEKE